MEEEACTKGQETAAAPRTPALPWTVRLQIFGLIAATNIAQRADGTVNRFVFSLAYRQACASARPDRLGVMSADVAVEASRGQWARVFSPSKAEPSAAPVPVVVYFHSGSFVLLSTASAPYDAMCRQFCRELGAVVVSVNYRLAPEHRGTPRPTTTGWTCSGSLRTMASPTASSPYRSTYPAASSPGTAPSATSRTTWRALDGRGLRRPGGGSGGGRPHRRHRSASCSPEFLEAIHAFYVFPELADAGKVVKGIKAFMDQNSSPKPTA